ncbi:MAG: hypothetical protein ACPG1A_17410, partial [Halioglobus sp.]
ARERLGPNSKEATMAVQLQREVAGTGVMADHWVIVSMTEHRNRNTNQFELQGTYSLWLDQAAFDADKEPIRNQRVTVTIPMTGNPNMSTLQVDLDAAAVAEGGPLEGGTVV